MKLVHICGPFVSCNQARCNVLQRRDFRRLLALRALRHFGANFLVLLQRFEAVALNLRKMREQVFVAGVRRDESKSFRIVKPLYSTCCHSRNPLNRVGRKAARNDRPTQRDGCSTSPQSAVIRGKYRRFTARIRGKYCRFTARLWRGVSTRRAFAAVHMSRAYTVCGPSRTRERKFAQATQSWEKWFREHRGITVAEFDPPGRSPPHAGPTEADLRWAG